MISLIKNADPYSQEIAIIEAEKSYTFQDLLIYSQKLATIILDSNADLNEQRIAFMVAPGFHYVAVQWAIWLAGGVAVPLCVSYPIPSLEYVIDDISATILIADSAFSSIISEISNHKKLRFIDLKESDIEDAIVVPLPIIDDQRNAMVLYTSGTTNLPKGVVSTHATIAAQISSLIEAWKWTSTDHVLCLLPLHHIHGIINVISCALWSGAKVEFLYPFTELGVFEAFKKAEINVFMAVPTIYYKLISHYDALPQNEKAVLTNCMSKFRLMVSGSAALPVSVMHKWKEISTHSLLERYGMTEIGMGISNPYDGERKAGYIGLPLPGVSVRLVNEHNQMVEPNEAGEIQIKGKNVFKEYWNKPDATQKAFTEDGWFKTGDIAIIEDKYYKMLGRDSVDIIKSGGYKISAIEIEEVLRTHVDIEDCSVLGIADDEWGELVVAVVTTTNTEIDYTVINQWIRAKMPAYKTPRKYKTVKELPRNAMGKVTKNDLKKLFEL